MLLCSALENGSGMNNPFNVMPGMAGTMGAGLNNSQISNKSSLLSGAESEVKKQLILKLQNETRVLKRDMENVKEEKNKLKKQFDELNKQKVFINIELKETKMEVEENLSTIMNLEAKVSKLQGNLAELEGEITPQSQEDIDLEGMEEIGRKRLLSTL